MSEPTGEPRVGIFGWAEHSFAVIDVRKVWTTDDPYTIDFIMEHRKELGLEEEPQE